MKILENQTGVQAPTVAFPKGFILDGTTLVGEGIYQDIVQTLQKLVIDADLTENDLYDNETNGYQIIQALQYFVQHLKTSSGKTVAIAAGVADLSSLDFDDFRHLITFTGGGDLDTISNVFQSGDYVNQSFKIRLGASTTFTNAGNLYLGGAEEVTYPATTIIELQFQSFLANKWHVCPYLPGSGLLTKIIDIGDWNMDADASTLVAHGLSDINKIRSISIMLRNDADDTVYKLEGSDSTSTVWGGVGSITSTNIRLWRYAGGQYDSTAFDSISYNRGWITIEYLP